MGAPRLTWFGDHGVVERQSSRQTLQERLLVLINADAK